MPPIIPASFWLSKKLQTDEGKRVTAGIADSLIREPIEMVRMMRDSHYLGRLEPTRAAKEAETEEWLERLYTSAVGEQNVAQTQRGYYETGEPKMVTTIKRPETLVGGIARDVGAFGASFVGLGKVTKPLKAAKAYQKAKAAAPKTTAIASAVARGEAAVQLTIDPYRANLANLIGDFIADDNDGYLGDIEKYLLDPIKSSQEKTQLENRIGLLAEGLVITSGVYALIKGVPPVAKSVTSAVRNNKESFVNSIKDLRTKGIETKQEFLNIIRNRTKEPEPITLAKEEGVSPKALRSQGKISALVSKTNLQFSTSPLVRSFESWRLRTFTARGNMTREMHERFLKSENTKQQWDTKIDFIGKELDDTLHTTIKQIKKSKGNKEALLAQVNRVLFTDFRVPTIQTVSKTGKGKQTTLGRAQAPTFEKELLKLPKSLHEPIKRARVLQDDISKLWLESSHLSPKAKKAWERELGVYFKKAYRLFDDPTYKPFIWSKTARNLIEHETIEFKRLDPTLSEVKARQQAIGKVNQIIASGKSGKTFEQSIAELEKLNPKDFMERSLIIPELKELLAPFDDAVSIVINSTKKASDHLQNLKFYDREWAMGENIYFFKKPTGIFTEQMPQGFGKLSGKAGNPLANTKEGRDGYKVYTTKQMRDYLTQSDVLIKDNIFNNVVMRPLLSIKYLAQKNATIYSILTNAKNFLGMNQFSLLSGVNPYNPRRIRQVHNMLRTQFRKSTKEQQAWYEKVSGYGLVGKNTVLGDLKGLADDLGKVSGIAGKLAQKIGTRKYNLKSFDSAATKFYTSVDDYGKLNMWYAEIENMTKVRNALPKGAKYDKYRKPDLQIEREAARLVRNNMPNYDMLPRNLKKLRRIPFVGAFYSFSAESMRNTINALRAIPTDFKIAHDLTRDGATKAAAIQTKRAMKRLVGFGSMVGAGEAVRRYLQDTQDISDAEYEYAKEYLPPYFRDSILMRNEKDNLVAFNYGSWDAINYPKITGKLAHNMMTDPNFNDADIWKEYLIPYLEDMGGSFVGPSISQTVINQYLSDGRNRRGALMYHPFDPSKKYRTYDNNWEQWTDKDNLELLLWNLGTMVPPFTPDVKRGINYLETKDFEQSDLGQDIDPLTKLIVGSSYSTLNNEYIETQYELKISRFLNAKKDRNNELWEAARQATTNKRFGENYFDANIAYYRDFTEFSKATHAAKGLGIDVTSLRLQKNMSGPDSDSLLGIENSTIMFKPLDFSLELEDYNSTTQLEMKLYDKNLMPLINTHTLPSEIATIDTKFRLIPVLISPEDLKEYPTISEVEDLLEREQKVVGGLVEGQEVPYAKEYPEERINPFTGEPYTALYYNTTQRKPVKEGGILEKAGQTVKSLYDTTRAIGSMKSPEHVLKIIDSRSKYISDQLYNPTDEQQRQLMDATREQWSEHTRQQSLMETELDELGKYRSKLLSENPQNTVETVKDVLSFGLQQAFISKFSKLGGAGRAIGLGGGRIIEGELADIEIAESYKGETPLLPSIYEPKALPSPPETKFLDDLPSESGLRALDLSESGEFSQLERNIKAGQKKGTIGQLINQAINKGRVTDEELKDLRLFGQTEWWGEDIGATKTTQEQLLEQMQERAARTRTEIRGDESGTVADRSLTPFMEPEVPWTVTRDDPTGVERGYPIWFEDTDGTDHSLIEMDETLATINQALDNPESPPEAIDVIARDFAGILKYEEETGEELWYSSDGSIGDMNNESVARFHTAASYSGENTIDPTTGEYINIRTEEEAVTFLQKLEEEEIERLVEHSSRMNYVTSDPYRKIVFEQYPSTYMIGNEGTGFNLIHDEVVSVADVEDRIYTYNEAEVQLRNYIRDNVDEAPFSTTTGSRPAQWRDQGTLPLMKDYEELTVIAEQPPSVSYGNVEGEHGMGENSIGHVQLSTRELGDGLDTTHIEAIQSDLIQSGEGGYLPYQKGWRTKVFRESIDRAIANGTNRVSWSPAWIQDMHWNQGTAIHNVADIELLAEVKKLEKEYGATFSFEEIVIDSKAAQLRVLQPHSDLDKFINIIEKGVNEETLKKWLHLPDLLEQQEVPFDQWSGLALNEIEHKEIDRLIKQGQGINKVTKVAKAKGRDLRTGEEVELKKLKVLDEELRIKPTGSSVERGEDPIHGTIKVQVPTLTFNEKAVSKWLRLGRRAYLQGGEVEVEVKEELPTLSDEELNNLLGIVTEKESLPKEKQSAWKEITKGIRASATGIVKGISSLLEKNEELTEEQLDYLRTLTK